MSRKPEKFDAKSALPQPNQPGEDIRSIGKLQTILDPGNHCQKIRFLNL
jgi:hypothetical protein